MQKANTTGPNAQLVASVNSRPFHGHGSQVKNGANMLSNPLNTINVLSSNSNHSGYHGNVGGNYKSTNAGAAVSTAGGPSSSTTGQTQTAAQGNRNGHKRNQSHIAGPGSAAANARAGGLMTPKGPIGNPFNDGVGGSRPNYPGAFKGQHQTIDVNDN